MFITAASEKTVNRVLRRARRKTRRATRWDYRGGVSTNGLF